MKLKILLNRLIATFFFIGYIPFASGTWASLVALVIWFLLPFHNFWFHVVVVVTLFFVGIFAAETTEKRIGEFDPPYIVIDEVVGMWLTMTIIPPLHFPKDIGLIAIAFALFRFFDITKIKPIDKLELIGGGFGIMIDDILAAVFTGVIFNIGSLIL